MEREPITWRPNAISPEDWDAKSREEQMAWWRENMSSTTPPSKRSMRDVPPLYTSGTLTRSECFLLICKRATDAETPQFLTECPDDILAILRENLAAYPGNDPNNWPRSVSMVSYLPWATPTPDDIEAAQRREQLAFFNGIAILKRHFDA